MTDFVALDLSDFKALLKLAERTVIYNVEHDRLTRNGAYEDTKEMVALLERMKALYDENLQNIPDGSTGG